MSSKQSCTAWVQQFPANFADCISTECKLSWRVPQQNQLKQIQSRTQQRIRTDYQLHANYSCWQLNSHSDMNIDVVERNMLSSLSIRCGRLKAPKADWQLGRHLAADTGMISGADHRSPVMSCSNRIEMIASTAAQVKLKVRTYI